MSKPKPYTLIYSFGIPGVGGGPIGGSSVRRGISVGAGSVSGGMKRQESFDTKEQAITRAEELMTSRQGRELVLYKDGKPLMAGKDFENYVSRRRQ
jgi:hypothetical protein